MPKLKTEVENFTETWKYFSVSDLKNFLEKENVKYEKGSIYQYLNKIKEENEIFDAGHGWYSILEKEFELETDPVEEFVSKFDEKYPELDFSVWSTEQIAPYFHHLPTKFVSFVYVDRNFHTAIFDYLRHEYDANLVLKNPGKNEAKDRYFIDQKPIVLRHFISQSQEEGHYASIEKILVDLYREEKKIGIVGESEYVRIFNNIVFDWRINVAKMLRYAGRRECKEYITNLLMSEKREN